MTIAELQEIHHFFEIPGRTNPAKILNGISISIREGDTIAITGPSGSGKTTLLNILGTLITPSSGNVLLQGKSVTEMNSGQLAELRNRFTGFIFQQHLLLPQLTVIENVLLPVIPVKDQAARRDAAGRARDLLQKVGLGELQNQFPSRMSVGECQRTAVVRALINQPGLLLADEPTGALDAANAETLVDLLLKLQSETGFALVLVTHDPLVSQRMKTQFRLLKGLLV